VEPDDGVACAKKTSPQGFLACELGKRIQRGELIEVGGS
jgi:hypothetical protein